MLDFQLPARRSHWAAAACLTLCAAIPLSTLTSGQQPATRNADLSGIVTDPSGARVLNATAIASNSSAGNREAARTDAVGAFAFHSFPAGRYMLEVRVPEFDIYQQNSVNVEAGTPAVVNPKLSVGGRRKSPWWRRAHAAAAARQVRPAYPPDLQAQGIEGTVLIEAVIRKEGVPILLTVRNTSVNREFADAALETIRQWRYNSTLLNGQPVEVMMTVTIDFKMKP